MRGRGGDPSNPSRTIIPPPGPERNGPHDREHGEDRRGERQKADVDRLQRPSPFVERRQDDAERAEQPPALPRGKPGDADAERQEAREHRERIVLGRGQQERGDETAQEAEDGDEDRIAARGESHRGHCHQQHPDERHDQRDEGPSRVHRVEGREENSDPRGVERVPGDAVLRRDPSLGHDDQRESGAESESGTQPWMSVRGAEEEYRREHQRGAGGPGEEANADRRPLTRRRRAMRGRVVAHSVFRYSSSASLSPCGRFTPYSCPMLPLERQPTSYGVPTYFTSSHKARGR